MLESRISRTNSQMTKSDFLNGTPFTVDGIVGRYKYDAYLSQIAEIGLIVYKCFDLRYICAAFSRRKI